MKIPCILTGLISLAAPLGAALLTPGAIDRVLDARTFVSQEELLQLFHDVRRSPESDISLDRQGIDYLRRRLHTYFPLGHCEAIRLSDDTLRITFSGPQKIAIPGMWRQAKLLLSQELVFYITDPTEDGTATRFELVRGYVNVKTSRLAKLASEFADDMAGTALLYRISPEHRYSVIGLEEHVPVSAASLTVHATDSSVAVDAVHPRFPEPDDLRFTPASVCYFGFNAELRGPDTLRYQDWKPIVNGPAYAQFSGLIDTVLADPDRAFAGGITKTQAVTFNLEAGRGSFTRGFRFGT